MDATNEYPTIVIDGTPREVRFTCLSMMMLQRAGVDISEPVKANEAVGRAMTMLHAAVSGAMPGITVDELAAKIDLADFPRVAQIVSEAIVKAFPQQKIATQKPAVQ